MPKIFSLLVLAFGSLSVSQLHAADGLYLGAGVGAASVKDNFNTETFDQEDVAYRAFVGWRFDQVPIIDRRVQAARREPGRSADSAARTDRSLCERRVKPIRR